MQLVRRVKRVLLVTLLLEASHVHHAVLELNHLWMSTRHCVSVVEMDLLLNLVKVVVDVTREQFLMSKKLPVYLVLQDLSQAMASFVSHVVPIQSPTLIDLNVYNVPRASTQYPLGHANRVLQEHSRRWMAG